MLNLRKKIIIVPIFAMLLFSSKVSAMGTGIDWHNNWRNNTIIGWNNDLSGNNVAAVQGMLTTAVLNPGPIDGYYGAQTHDAIMRYQSRFGLSADGIAGPNTFGSMQTFLIWMGQRVVVDPVTYQSALQVSYGWIPNGTHNGSTGFLNYPDYDYWIYELGDTYYPL